MKKFKTVLKFYEEETLIKEKVLEDKEKDLILNCNKGDFVNFNCFKGKEAEDYRGVVVRKHFVISEFPESPSGLHSETYITEILEIKTETTKF